MFENQYSRAGVSKADIDYKYKVTIRNKYRASTKNLAAD